MIDQTTEIPQPQRLIDIQAPPLVVLSEAAAAKLTELTAGEANAQTGLRVYVYSGGCSGFRYGMMLEDQPTPEDITIESRGIKVYVDGQSTQHLMGSEIDYLDTLMGAGFTVNNPNAVSGCGCGSSFRTADDPGQARSCSPCRTDEGPPALRPRRLDAAGPPAAFSCPGHSGDPSMHALSPCLTSPCSRG